MHPLLVEAVQIARDIFAVSRDPCHDHPHASFVLVTNARGFDLDDLAIFRHPDGRFARPPSGGWGRPARADHVDVHSPSRSRKP
eukprot:806089-Pyramimonas_sp.AAC.1